MTAANEARQQGAEISAETEFSSALRRAISASGLSLDRLQARLQAFGVSISVTALSYWQSGKRQPERQGSLSAVRALEEILNIPSGSLLGLLQAPRPRGTTSRKSKMRSGDSVNFPRDVLQPLLARVGAPDALERRQQLKLVGLHDRCEIAACGGQRSVLTRAVFQSSSDRQDRWLLVYEQSGHAAGAPKLNALRNCVVGDMATDAEHGITVAELIFAKPLNRSETLLIEYSINNEGPPYPDCQNTHYREFRRPIREYLLDVSFDEEISTKKHWKYSRRTDIEAHDRQEITVDNTNGVHAIAVDFGPGVFGIEWN